MINIIAIVELYYRSIFLPVSREDSRGRLFRQLQTQNFPALLIGVSTRSNIETLNVKLTPGEGDLKSLRSPLNFRRLT